jgi:enoyl-CoA hydratase/carnithine racemase
METIMAMTYDEILYDVTDQVATITINRPDQLNALTDLTQAEIRHALDQSERNPDVIGTVLTGAGSPAIPMTIQTISLPQPTFSD